MQILRIALAGAAVLALLPAQQTKPYEPTAEEQQQLLAKAAQLDIAVKGLRAKKVDQALLADVEIYRKAVEWLIRYPEEFYTKAYFSNALSVLDTGMARARELEQNKPSWVSSKGRFSLAYRSRVDGSVQ